VSDADLERKARTAELLLTAARTFGDTPEPDAVYDRFHELLARVVPHDGVVVSAYDAGDGLIRCEYAWSNGARLDASALPPLELKGDGAGMQSRVFTTGEPLLENDVAGHIEESEGGTYYDVDESGTMRKLPDSGPPRTKAAMMVPVRHEGAVVGVVQVMADEATYTLDDVEILDGIVAQMAAAVRNARLQKERHTLAAAEAAARAAAAERERTAQVLDAVADGVMLVDAAGSVRFWNRAAERITGRRRVPGRLVTDVFSDWLALAGRIPVGAGDADPRSATLPVTLGERDLWLCFVAVRNPEGVVYAFRDVTNEHLLDEEKSDFIATISHELRTPMTSVYGAAATLLRDDVRLSPEQQRELLEMIAGQAARLSQITDEVLLATRLDRGAITVERESVEVVALVAATIDAMRPQLPEGTTLELAADGDVPPAAAAPDHLQQVLLNLLDNAVKYGGGGPVRVEVRGEGDEVCIRVCDNGPGIAYVDQPRVFEKFFRSGPTLTRATGGTGLGLYICRELVQRMNGRLELQSEPGAGASFVVSLPRAG